MGCTFALVFVFLASTFKPRVATQQMRCAALKSAAQPLQALKPAALGRSGQSRDANYKEQQKAVKKVYKHPPELHSALAAIEYGL